MFTQLNNRNKNDSIYCANKNRKQVIFLFALFPKSNKNVFTDFQIRLTRKQTINAMNRPEDRKTRGYFDLDDCCPLRIVHVLQHIMIVDYRYTDTDAVVNNDDDHSHGSKMQNL